MPLRLPCAARGRVLGSGAPGRRWRANDTAAVRRRRRCSARRAPAGGGTRDVWAGGGRGAVGIGSVIGGMRGMVPNAAHRALIWSRIQAVDIRPRTPGSALVLEPDLELDLVLDDLAVLDPGGRLDHLDRADVAHGLRRRRDRLAGGVAPGSGTRPDHLPDDDHTHCAPPAARPPQHRLRDAPRIDTVRR